MMKVEEEEREENVSKKLALDTNLNHDCSKSFQSEEDVQGVTEEDSSKASVEHMEESKSLAEPEEALCGKQQVAQPPGEDPKTSAGTSNNPEKPDATMVDVEVTQIGLTLGLSSSQDVKPETEAELMTRHKELSKLVQQVRSDCSYMSTPVPCDVCELPVEGVMHVLVCDSCEKGYHSRCLPRHYIDLRKTMWFCPKCIGANRTDNPFGPVSARRRSPVLGNQSSPASIIRVKQKNQFIRSPRSVSRETSTSSG